MNKIIAFIRPDDGEIFSLNEDEETFSLKWLKEQFPNHLHHKFSKTVLICHKFTPIYQ